jgi:flagellar basal-body rod protein FlgF
MSITSYIALSSQMALQRQMDVVANNVANASTPAYKGERVMFAEYLIRADATHRFSFVEDRGTVRDTKPGPITRTGNPLDVALQGDGYLAVQTPLGTRYTRAGRFQLDPGGQIVTPEGYPVLGEGDQPLAIPPDAGEVTINADGTVRTQQQGEAGKFQIVRFDRDQDLKPAANGLYVTSATGQPATDTKVLQGMVEEANVQPIVEITRMMSVARTFAAAKEMLDGEHDRLKNAIDRLGRVA